MDDCKFVALFDYIPENERRELLSIKKGDILNVVKECDEQAEGWLWVKNDRGLQGFAPKNYIRRINDAQSYHHHNHNATSCSSTATDSECLNLILKQLENTELNDRLERTCKWVCKQESLSSISSGIGSELNHIYEEIGEKLETTTSNKNESSTTGAFKPSMVLWAQTDKVKSSLILNEMSEDEIKLQEAMFEVLSSEQSYLRNLKILINHFYSKLRVLQQYQSIISESQFQLIFSNILHVFKASENLVADHEERWSDCVKMHDVCYVLRLHFENYFENIFIKYCENHIIQLETLHSLMQSNEMFNKLVNQLQHEKEAERMPLTAYLLLPIQRIMKYKILIMAIMKFVKPNSSLHASCEEALRWAHRIAFKCNEAVNSRVLVNYERTLKFPKHMPKIELSMPKAFRQLIREQQVTLLKFNPRGLNVSSEKSVLLLRFTDVLLISSTKGHKVMDYCNISNVQMKKIRQKFDDELNNGDFYTLPSGLILPSKYRYPCQLIILRNYEDDSVCYTVNFSEEKERNAWIDSLNVRSQVSCC